MKGELTPDPPPQAPWPGTVAAFHWGWERQVRAAPADPPHGHGASGRPSAGRTLPLITPRRLGHSFSYAHAIRRPESRPWWSVSRGSGRGQRGVPACHTQRVQSAGVTSWSGRGGSARGHLCCVISNSSVFKPYLRGAEGWRPLRSSVQGRPVEGSLGPPGQSRRPSPTLPGGIWTEGSDVIQDPLPPHEANGCPQVLGSARRPCSRLELLLREVVSHAPSV